LSCPRSLVCWQRGRALLLWGRGNGWGKCELEREWLTGLGSCDFGYTVKRHLQRYLGNLVVEKGLAPKGHCAMPFIEWCAFIRLIGANMVWIDIVCT